MGVYIPNMEKPKECGDCNFVQAFWDDKRWLFRCLVTDKIAEDCPLIEIDEPKVGRWIRAEGELICSICEYPAEFNPLSSDFIESNYCPNCGAKMKGE